jgi:hypothetical protein
MTLGQLVKLKCRTKNLTFSALSRFVNFRRLRLSFVDDADADADARLFSDVLHLDGDDGRLVAVGKVTNRVDVSTRLCVANLEES